VNQSLRRLSAHAAMCALGIDKLRQHPSEILLLWRHGEQNALGGHVLVESLDIGNSKSQFDFSRWILVGSRMQSETSFARRELAPSGVTSKAANGDRFKTGQRKWPGTRLFYAAAS
jgi:hypothetical protein